MPGHTVRVEDWVYNNARDESVSCNGCDCSFEECHMHMKMNTIIQNISLDKRTNKEYYILYNDAGYPFLYRIRELDDRKAVRELNTSENKYTFDSVIRILKNTKHLCSMSKSKQKVI